MLTLFPIMFLSLLAHAILRVGLGAIFVYFGGKHLSSKHPMLLRVLGGVELIVGAMLVVGFLTQLAALLGIVLAIVFLVMHKRFVSELPSRAFYILAIAASLSLVITGAGAFAIDLPF